MTPMTPEEIDRVARKRAGAKLRWYAHALIYLVVNSFLFLLAGMGQHRWSIYPAAGWGLGLALHGIAVWMLGTGSNLREQMIQKERDKLQRHKGI